MIDDDIEQIKELARLEGEDPKTAVQRFRRAERSLGLTGKSRPTCIRAGWDIEAMAGGVDSPEDALLKRAEERALAEELWSKLPRLSERDRRVIELYASGWLQRDIANELAITPGRVSQIVQCVRRKVIAA